MSDSCCRNEVSAAEVGDICKRLYQGFIQKQKANLISSLQRPRVNCGKHKKGSIQDDFRWVMFVDIGRSAPSPNAGSPPSLLMIIKLVCVCLFTSSCLTRFLCTWSVLLKICTPSYDITKRTILHIPYRSIVRTISYAQLTNQVRYFTSDIQYRVAELMI